LCREQTEAEYVFPDLFFLHEIGGIWEPYQALQEWKQVQMQVQVQVQQQEWERASQWTRA
jgi:hypothetical protein